MPSLTVVVPVLDDFDAVQRLLADIGGDDVELIIVDGGHDTRLDELVRDAGSARVIRTPAGRGVQMNAGAALASGTWLLFLHADSLLPGSWREQILQTSDTHVGGWFRFGLDDRAWQARIIERLTRWRARHLELAYGDQGLFVRRSRFHQLGGFRDWPLMEDVDFVRRLSALGPVREIPLPLLTSARRWRRDGWFRRSMRNLVLIGLYFGGVSPIRLARWYSGGGNSKR